MKRNDELLPDELLGDVYGGAGKWLLSGDEAANSQRFDSPTWKAAVMDWEPEAAPLSSPLSSFDLFLPPAA